MSEGLERMSPDEQRARDAVRALPPVTADADYRARLREAFTRGDAGTLPRIVPLPRRRAAPAWVAVTAAAAAAVAVLFAVNRGPRWEVIGTNGTGVIDVDGHAVSATAPEALGAALHPGARVRVPMGG